MKFFSQLDSNARKIVLCVFLLLFCLPFVYAQVNSTTQKIGYSLVIGQEGRSNVSVISPSLPIYFITSYYTVFDRNDNRYASVEIYYKDKHKYEAKLISYDKKLGLALMSAAIPQSFPRSCLCRSELTVDNIIGYYVRQYNRQGGSLGEVTFKPKITFSSDKKYFTITDYKDILYRNITSKEGTSEFEGTKNIYNLIEGKILSTQTDPKNPSSKKKILGMVLDSDNSKVVGITNGMIHDFLKAHLSDKLFSGYLSDACIPSTMQFRILVNYNSPEYSVDNYKSYNGKISSTEYNCLSTYSDIYTKINKSDTSNISNALLKLRNQTPRVLPEYYLFQAYMLSLRAKSAQSMAYLDTLANYQYSSNKGEEIEAYTRSNNGEFRPLYSWLSKESNKKPDDEETLRQLYLVSSQINDVDVTILHLNKYIRVLRPKPEKKQELIKALNDLKTLKISKREDLEEVQKELASVDPNNFEFTKDLADIYFNKDKIHQAKESYERAYKLNPKNAHVTDMLAYLFIQKLNDKDKGCAYIKISIANGSNRHLQYYNSTCK